MEYDCQLVSIASLSTTFNKVVRPLCSSCKNRNCSNPIESKKVSIFGKVHSTRVYNTGSGFFIVSYCDGFIDTEEDEEDVQYDL